jgi:hypothetical protein
MGAVRTCSPNDSQMYTRLRMSCGDGDGVIIDGDGDEVINDGDES